MKGWTKVALVGTLLVGVPAAARTAGEPVTMGELPTPARATIEHQVRGRPLQSLERQNTARGVYDDARFRTLTEGLVEVSVDDHGRVLARPNRLDQPSGDGP